MIETGQPLTVNNIETKRLFLCDFCGKQKSGKKYSVFDENWNRQRGVYQCEECFGKQCDGQSDGAK